MATTRLSDIIVPEVFAPYALRQTLETNRYILSGAVAVDSVLSSFLAGGGSTYEMPKFVTPEDDYAVSSDDPAVDGVPIGVTANADVAVRLSRNNHYSSMALTRELAGADPLSAVVSQVAYLTNKKRESEMLSQLTGLFDTALSGLVSDIANEDGDNATATEVFNKDTFIGATGGFADRLSPNTIIICHSDIYRKMQMETTLVSQTIPVLGGIDIEIPVYLGHPVVVDDRVGKVAGGTSGFKYTTYIVNPGTIGIGSGLYDTLAYEDEKSGNGAGQELLRIRDSFSFHVAETAWVGAGVNPDQTALATGSNWGLVGAGKNVGMAKLVSN